MTGRYCVLAYWGPRRESAEACAPKVLHMFKALSEIHPTFGCWIDDLRGREPALASSLDVDEAVRWLAMGQNRSETRGLPIPEFGYRIMTSNDMYRTPRLVALEGKVGGYVRGPLMANMMLLAAGPLQTDNEDIINYPNFRSVLLTFTSIWNPTWCGVMPTDLRDLLPGEKKRRGSVPRLCGGWLTYLAKPLAQRITPPRSVRSEQVGGGLLMIATEETFRLDNPAHVAAACEIDAALAPIDALPWPPDG